jgi:hypothetical protein
MPSGNPKMEEMKADKKYLAPEAKEAEYIKAKSLLINSQKY